MTTTTTTNGTATSATTNPKKTNILDHHSIKHLLDETVTEIVTSRGYSEDVRTSNVRLLIGAIIIIIALFAQFYNKKFPDNKNFLIGCILSYPFLSLKMNFYCISKHLMTESCAYQRALIWYQGVFNVHIKVEGSSLMMDKLFRFRSRFRERVIAVQNE